MSNSGIHIQPSHKGLLHEDLGIAPDKPIPLDLINQKLARRPSKKLKKRLVFAKNVKTHKIG